MRTHKFYTAWCRSLNEYLHRHQIAGHLNLEFCARAEISTQALSNYLTGRVKPPLHKLVAMANVLHLSEEERQNFAWLALEPYCHSTAWEQLGRFRTEVDRLTHLCQQLGMQHSHTITELSNAQAELVSVKAKLASQDQELVGLRQLAADLAREQVHARRELVDGINGKHHARR